MIAAALDRVLKDELSRYSYKPGYSFMVGITNDGMADFILTNPSIVNSYDPDTTLYFYMREQSRIGPHEDIAKLVQSTVCFLTRAAEIHERDEWLKYDGELLSDPHAELS